MNFSIADIFTMQFASALFTIIIIDLVLAGDNAIVIGLAARNVPIKDQKKVILWGMFGAIAVRIFLTTIVVYLLKIPGFLLVGGLALVWVARKLVSDEGGSEHNIVAKSSVRSAVATIIVADTVMGVDNVLAVGGAAQGSWLLVVLGLAISIPIVIWGSQLILKYVEKYPIIMYIGGAVLAWTSCKMMVSEPFLKNFLEDQPWARVAIYILTFEVAVLWLWLSKVNQRLARITASLTFLAIWIAVFQWFKVALGLEINSLGESQADYTFLNFAWWIGWVPFVVLIDRYLQSGGGPSVLKKDSTQQ